MKFNEYEICIYIIILIILIPLIIFCFKKKYNTKIIELISKRSAEILYSNIPKD